MTDLLIMTSRRMPWLIVGALIAISGWPGLGAVQQFCLRFVPPRFVQTAPSPSTPPVAAVPRLAFEKYTLPNGLDVILSRDTRLPMVAVNVWYHVGPANEAPGRTGFAHLFEHMMFQGSKHTPPDSHFKMLEAAGATEINGTTDLDRTNYFQTVPSNQLELALWIESDRMGYLLDRVDARALVNQQDVVRNERRQSVENRPYGLAQEALVQLLYPKGHPYYADVIGSHEDIQSAKLADVKSFFKQYYVPNNASLAIAGDFDVASAKALVEKYFGSLKRGQTVPALAVTTPSITAERRRVVRDRVNLPRVSMAWITPAAFKPGDADARIAAAVLGDGRASRLYRALVYDRQLAQDVFAYQQSQTLGSMFQIAATARSGKTVEELERAIGEEIEKLRAEPPAASEVARARNQIETRLFQGLERIGGFGGVSDRLNLYNHYLGTPDYLTRDVERFRAVTPASVHVFVREHLKTTARGVVHAVPGTPDAGPVVPTPPAAGGAGEGAEAVNADAPWRATIPRPAGERPLKLPAIVSTQLPNGLTVYLSERTGLPIVSASLVVRAGSGLNPVEKPGLADFTAAMLDEGTTTRTATEIADQVAQLGATLTTGSSADATVIGITGLRTSFDQALELVADVVLRPSFPASEVERQRALRSGQLLQQRESPPILADHIVARVLYGESHPYGLPSLGTDATLASMAREDLLGFWRTHFVPSRAALVVAGDISLAELERLASKAFGEWKGSASATLPLSAVPTTQARVVVVDKAGAPQTQVRVATVGLPRTTPDLETLEVLNEVLGGLFSSRINLNLREAKGYTYGARSGFSYRLGPGPFAISSGVRTDVTAPAVREVFSEVTRMRSEPMSDDELQMAKQSLTRSLPNGFATSTGTASRIAELFIYGLPAHYYEQYASRVRGVTAGAARDAAQKYLAPERLVVVAIGDRRQIEAELRKLNVGPLEIRRADGGVIAE